MFRAIRASCVFVASFVFMGSSLGNFAPTFETSPMVQYQSGDGSSFAYTVKSKVDLVGYVAGTTTPTAEGLKVVTQGLMVSKVAEKIADTTPGKPTKVPVLTVTVVELGSETVADDGAKPDVAPPKNLKRMNLRATATAYQWRKPAGDKPEDRVDARFKKLLDELARALQAPKGQEPDPAAIDAAVKAIKGFKLEIDAEYAMRLATEVTQTATETDLRWEPSEGVMKDNEIVAGAGENYRFILNLEGTPWIEDRFSTVPNGLVSDNYTKPVDKLGEFLGAGLTFPFVVKTTGVGGSKPDSKGQVTMAQARIYIDPKSGKLGFSDPDLAKKVRTPSAPPTIVAMLK